MYNENTKKSIYKWRQTHKEQWDEYHNNKQKEYNEKNRDQILAKKKQNYEYKRFLFNNNTRIEFELFRNIDL